MKAATVRDTGNLADTYTEFLPVIRNAPWEHHGVLGRFRFQLLLAIGIYDLLALPKVERGLARC